MTSWVICWEYCCCFWICSASDCIAPSPRGSQESRTGRHEAPGDTRRRSVIRRTSENTPSREREKSAGAVVATDSVSVNAEYDNGATIPRPPRPQRRYDSSTHRVAVARIARRANSAVFSRAEESWDDIEPGAPSGGGAGAAPILLAEATS